MVHRPALAILCSAAALLLLPACASGPAPVTRSPRALQGDGDGDAANANNPLANMTALNFQNYSMQEVSGSPQTANQFWVRYAQPVSTPMGDWLVRASLPLNNFPTGPGMTESGMGDFNVFAAYLFETENPAVSAGVGPLIGAPTATDDALGADQWSLGAAAVYFNAASPEVQYGGLLTYQHGVGDRHGDPRVNLMVMQPFGFLQLGSGAYLRTAPLWVFDLENGDHNVPFGLGLGKVVRVDNTVFNFFLEPQFAVLNEGFGQPEFQVFVGLNLQFVGK